MKDHIRLREGGKWIKKTCPPGEGMVDFPKAFSLFAGGGFAGVIPLHVEYEPSDVPGAIAKDLAFLKQQIARAYSR